MDGIANQPGGVMNIQFVHKVGAVRLGCIHADAQQRSDFFCCLPLGYQSQHLALAIAERPFRHLVVHEECLNHSAREEERAKLARELHDGATQNLVTLSLHLGRMRKKADNGQALSGTLDKCMHLAEECTNELRTVSYLLHPPLLEELGLNLALNSYVEGFSQRSGIGVTVDTSGNLDALGFDVNLAVFRIVQEALSNIHRHSHSGTASILVARDHDLLTLEITDQGCGIPSGTNHRGVGLASMRERVRLLKGRLEIKSGATGTSITAFLPLAEAGASSSSAVA